jgi:CRP/FNR family nitrogen fixation transcriptional regulator
MLIIGRTTSTKKVGSFLLSMSERLDRRRTERIVLPMTRYDIADYLAISVETVSRALTELKRRGAISLDGTRLLTIHDPDALEVADV